MGLGSFFFFDQFYHAVESNLSPSQERKNCSLLVLTPILPSIIPFFHLSFLPPILSSIVPSFLPPSLASLLLLSLLFFPPLFLPPPFLAITEFNLNFDLR